MEGKKIAIGLGAGLVTNSLVEKSMSKVWDKIGSQFSEDQKAKFSELINSGMSEEDAALYLEKNSPLWKKLGSRRINGILSLGLGYAAFAMSKNTTVKAAGSGIMFAGAFKTLFPEKSLDLEFFK